MLAKAEQLLAQETYLALRRAPACATSLSHCFLLDSLVLGRRSMRFIACAHLLMLAACTAASAQVPAPDPAKTTVPVIGCARDGQSGPIPAPPNTTREVSLPPKLASRLALYAALNSEGEPDLGVLGPRGWSCFGVYGSSGSGTYIAPQPLNADNILTSKFQGFAGPAIQTGVILGDTSGRFFAARLMARFFPQQRAMVQRVIDEKMSNESDYVFEPWPQDKLTRRSPSLVEYVTPANAQGAGTASRLLPGSQPITGFVALVGEAPNVAQFAVRLPPDMADLAAVIVSDAEKKLVIN
jgi:hypothetical protein